MYQVMSGGSSDDVSLSCQDFVVSKESFRSCLVDVEFVSKETLSCLCLTINILEGGIELIYEGCEGAWDKGACCTLFFEEGLCPGTGHSLCHVGQNTGYLGVVIGELGGIDHHVEGQ